ncbi:MAG: DHH family phosphoesterase [Nanoarchaeota archaeon]|nr:DHH family phosphoesterase [Nanoarchaeota archaeon]
MSSTDFEEKIKQTANHFKTLRPSVVRIIANQDSDGIAATAILIKALERENLKYVATIVRGVTKRLIEELSNEHYDVYCFLDLGSTTINLIEQLNKKHLFVFDHHKPEEKGTRVIHLNPQLHELDGTRDLSAAGVTYLFTRALNEANKNNAYLALIGAIGDGQEDKGFSGYNQDILDSAVTLGTVTVEQDLRIFGMQTKPLHKALEYSTSPYIPNVTGNEKQAIKFLEENNIKTYEKGRWRTLKDLEEEEIKRLIIAITTKRIGSDENDEIYGPVYLLNEESEDSILKDLREYSTVLNCSARMKKHGIGIATCLGNKEAKEQALELHERYRKDIIEALNWFYRNKGKQGKVEEGKGYILINAEENIRDYLIGTLCSLISRSNIYEDGIIIIGLAHGLDDTTKISARIAGINKNNTNLNTVLTTITAPLGLTSGGHSFAAGTSIPQEQEQTFINKTREVLNNLVTLENTQKTV